MSSAESVRSQSKVYYSVLWIGHNRKFYSRLVKMWGKLLLCLSLTLVEVFSAKIPKELRLQKCNGKDPKFQECLRLAIQDAIPKLKNGAPTIGLPPLDPLEIIELSIDPGKEGPLSLSLKFKNFKIYGIADEFRIDSLVIDKNKKTVSINATNPHISMKGRYQSKGRMLAIPIDGEGPFNIQLSGVQVEVVMKLKEVVRKGVKYCDLVDMDYNVVNASSMKVRMENIIKGNKDLDDGMNASLNENSSELAKQMNPAFSKALRMFFKAMTERFFSKVPTLELFDGSPFA